MHLRRAVVAALLLAACRSSLQDIDREKLSYSVGDFRPSFALGIPISASVFSVDGALRVDNANDIPIEAERLEFEILLRGRPVLRGLTMDRIKIPRLGSGSVPFRAQATQSELRDLFQEVRRAYETGNAEYSVRGRLTIRTLLGPITVPIDVSGNRFVR